MDYLQSCHSAKQLTYQRILHGVEKVDRFWDLVVLTACDQAQADSYTAQIQKKRERNEIPAQTIFQVMADPPGSKIGNGGSTLYVLDCLEKLYDSKLDNMLVLIIHAGGYSKRLPQASAVGKIFTSLPLDCNHNVGSSVSQMLELKLLMYVEFPQRMNPGVFVTCADDIELFDSSSTPCSFLQPGFTALAHPSPILIGETHGVFVLDDTNQVLSNDYAKPEGTREVLQSKCLKFLHKPKEAKMRLEGAVVTSKIDSSRVEFVYTDSAFYFDRETSKKLHKLYKLTSPLNCEIDAYGDFLQALGENATAEYTLNTVNVISAESMLDTRKLIFEHLKGTPLNVLVFNSSKFYHIGTMEEYLEHFSGRSPLLKELGGFKQIVVGSKAPSSYENDNLALLCVLFESFDTCQFGEEIVIEHSYIGLNVRIGRKCILSNIETPDSIEIPDNSFLLTVDVAANQANGSVTIAFGVNDDLKKTYKDKSRVMFAGVPLLEVIEKITIDQDSIWDDQQSSYSLWDARIFPISNSKKQSVLFALQYLHIAQQLREKIPVTTLQTSPHSLQGFQGFTSFEKMLKIKDFQSAMNWRDRLEEDIYVSIFCNINQGKVVPSLEELPLVEYLIRELPLEFSKENQESTQLYTFSQKLVNATHKSKYTEELTLKLALKLWNLALEKHGKRFLKRKRGQKRDHSRDTKSLRGDESMPNSESNSETEDGNNPSHHGNKLNPTPTSSTTTFLSAEHLSHLNKESADLGKTMSTDSMASLTQSHFFNGNCSNLHHTFFPLSRSQSTSCESLVPSEDGERGENGTDNGADNENEESDVNRLLVEYISRCVDLYNGKVRLSRKHTAEN